jgi:hypothetical protein
MDQLIAIELISATGCLVAALMLGKTRRKYAKQRMDDRLGQALRRQVVQYQSCDENAR